MNNSNIFNDLDGVNLSFDEYTLKIKTKEYEEEVLLSKISGIGIYEDKKSFEKGSKNSKVQGRNGKISGISLIVIGLFVITLDVQLAQTLKIVEGSVFLLIGIILLVSNLIYKHEIPSLDSYIRISISGVEKNIKFNKTENSLKELENFLKSLKSKI